MSTPIKIHCPQPFSGNRIHALFYFKYPTEKNEKILFNKTLPENFFETDALYVDVAEAAMIVLPNNFTTLTDAAREYIKTYAEVGERYGIPVFLFSHGDLTDKLSFDHRVCVFRYSIYRSSAGNRDIMSPTITEDLGRNGIVLRKKASKPVVSFCGQGGFPSGVRWMKYILKNFLWDVRALFDRKQVVRKVGVYWRRAAMRACNKSPRVDTLFIVRNSYSGHRDSILLDPSRARQEYIESIGNSDFVLAPKGDGNYSSRFQEALSMGRFPVYIETDSVLPLESDAEYGTVMVRVPFYDVRNAPQYIEKFYNSMDAQEFECRQRLAREKYEKYLMPRTFYARVFESYARNKA